jgi:predicted DNA-binding protein (UPF0251 family)
VKVNRRERVEHPGSCEECTNKICLETGKPCAKVEAWLQAEEKGSSISWDPDTVMLCGEESYLDKLALEHPQGDDPFTLDYYGVESLDDFHITDKQAEAIRMFYFQSKRVAACAKDLGISSHAVLERLDAARARIKKQLNRRLLFTRYLRGMSVIDIFGDTGIKNSFLAKRIIELYFEGGYPASTLPAVLRNIEKLNTTLGVIYKYVKIVQAYLEDFVTAEHKKTLTDIYY